MGLSNIRKMFYSNVVKCCTYIILFYNISVENEDDLIFFILCYFIFDYVQVQGNTFCGSLGYGIEITVQQFLFYKP